MFALGLMAQRPLENLVDIAFGQKAKGKLRSYEAGNQLLASAVSSRLDTRGAEESAKTPGPQNASQ